MDSLTPLEHSPIGGSTAPRNVKCPGNLTLLRMHPDLDVDTSGAAAKEGTLLHEVMAHLMEGEECEPGFEFGGVTYTEDMREFQVKPALRLLDKFEAEHGLLGDYKTEEKVPFPGIPGAFGTTDVAASTEDDVFVIVDWKFGYHDVPAEENMSLLYYAAAFLNTYRGFDPASGVVKLVIIQPKADQPLKVWETNIERVERFIYQMQDAAKLAQDSEIPVEEKLNEGDHCTYCKVAGRCPLKQGKAQKLVASMTKAKKPDAMSGDELAQWLDDLDSLSEFETALRRDAHGRIERGEEVGDYGLRPKKGRRYWVDEAATLTRLRGWKIGKRDAMELKIKSPAKIEAILKDRGEQKRLASLKKLTDSASSGMNLVKGAAGEYTPPAKKLVENSGDAQALSSSA